MGKAKETLKALATVVVAVALPAHAGQFPAVTASIQTVARSIDGAVTTTDSQFYRDGQGRTRTEGGGRVVIHDPVAGVVIVLDTVGRLAVISRPAPSAPSGSSPGPSASGPISNGRILRPFVNNVVNLGSEMVNGVLATGERHTANFPPGTAGSVRFRTVTTERWSAPALGLSVLTRITDSGFGETDTSYSNIITNPPLDPGLFQVPSGYRATGLPARTAPSN